MLGKYASHLMESGKTMEAIELYRKANKATESAKLLARVAEDAAKTKVRFTPLLMRGPLLTHPWVDFGCVAHR